VRRDSHHYLPGTCKAMPFPGLLRRKAYSTPVSIQIKLQFSLFLYCLFIHYLVVAYLYRNSPCPAQSPDCVVLKGGVSKGSSPVIAKAQAEAIH
jgi:hypothetical protein